MSRYKLMILCMFLCGCLAAGTLAVKNGAGRRPSSVPAVEQLVKYPNNRINVEKIMRLQEQRSRHTFTKLKKPMAINLSLIDEKIELDQPFTLRAEVSPLNAINGSRYKWTIDSSLEVLSGPTDGVLNELQPGESKTLELTLKAHQKKSSNIFLHVYSEESGKKIGASGHFNTAKHMDLPLAVSNKKSVKKIPVKRVYY